MLKRDEKKGFVFLKKLESFDSNIALMQIFILIFGIIAIGYAIGSEIGVVSAALSVGTAIAQ